MKKIKEGEVLYIRTDLRVEGTSTVNKQDYDDHISYLREIAKERYFLGGGYVDDPGGMIIFEAISETEAQSICDKDPLISRGFYTYRLQPWEIIIQS